MRNGQSVHIAKVDVADPSWTDLSTVACSKSRQNQHISRSLTPSQSFILNQKWLEACGCMSMEIQKEKWLTLAHTCRLELHIDPTINVHFLVYVHINGDADRKLLCSVCDTARMPCLGPMGFSCS